MYDTLLIKLLFIKYFLYLLVIQNRFISLLESVGGNYAQSFIIIRRIMTIYKVYWKKYIASQIACTINTKKHASQVVFYIVH